MMISDEETIFVPLDKDIRRRCRMSKQGYLYRLWRGYVKDAEFYEEKNDTTFHYIV